jgi:uncharacterized protein YkwD
MPGIAMRINSRLALLGALALAGCAGEPLETGPIDARIERQVAAAHVDPAAAVAAITAYRASHGLGPVRLDPALTAMAQRQADAMVAGNALSHTVGGAFTARLAGSGVDATEAGENLGGGYYSLDEAMTGWRGSPEHNANLLIKNATRIGIAIAKDARTRYRVYWALELAAEPRRTAATTSTLLPLAPGAQ